MKKKKILIPIVIILLIACLLGIFTFINKNDSTKNVKNNITEVDNTIQTDVSEFAYSEQQLQDFAKAVDERREFEIADVDLQPREEYYIVKILKSEGSAEELKTYKEGISDPNFTFFLIGENNYIDEIFDAKNLKLSDFINEDLSLKHPEALSGYIYKDGLINNMNDWKVFYGYDVDYSYNQFVTNIEKLDKEFSINDIYVEKINKYFVNKKCFNNKMIYFDYENSKYDTNDIVGSSLIRLNKINNEPIKAKSINRIQQLFKYLPSNFDSFELIYETLGKHIEVTNNYSCFSDKNNLFEDRSEYINYYPYKVNKIDDNKIEIVLKVSQPLYSERQLRLIKNNIEHYFINKDLLYKHEQNFDVIITCLYKDLSLGMFDEFHSFSLFADGKKGEQRNKSLDTYSYFNVFDFMQNEVPWYPKEEWQTLIKAYSEKIKPLYDNDEQYSIFEKIKEVSIEQNVDYDETKNAIMSYYWLVSRIWY